MFESKFVIESNGKHDFELVRHYKKVMWEEAFSAGDGLIRSDITVKWKTLFYEQKIL